MARAGRLLALAGILALPGCEDSFADPTWVALPDTAILFSLARPELELESAFNFYERRTVALERPGAATVWDVALDTRGGQLVLIAPGALGITSRARVTTLPGMTFAEVQEAPLDTLAYTATTPVPLSTSSVYVIRTAGSAQCGGGSFYAKMQPLAIDVASGRLEFVYDSSPFCNDRRLVPPDTT
jgi:hypothetical protein